jgi:hypothetical protein
MRGYGQPRSDVDGISPPRAPRLEWRLLTGNVSATRHWFLSGAPHNQVHLLEPLQTAADLPSDCL